MAKTLLIAGETTPGTTGASQTRFSGFVSGHGTNFINTESDVYRTYRIAGTISMLYGVIATNDRGASTLRIRINGANGNSVLSVGASATGEFEDTVNTDSITAGDSVDIQLATGAGGTTFTVSIYGGLFNASSNTVVGMGVDFSNFSAASTTRYTAWCGAGATINNESNVQMQFSGAATGKNFFVNVSANARTTTTTFRTRVNAADGNMVISISGGATGLFEDTTNTDTLSGGELYNHSTTTGTGTETITCRVVSVSIESTNNIFFMGARANATQNANLTTYGIVSDKDFNGTSETTARADANIGSSLTNLWCYLSSNSVTANSTLQFRKNGGNGNNVVTLTASTTGEFEDTVNTDTLVAADEINLSLITGATGTSLNIQGYSMLINNTETGVQTITKAEVVTIVESLALKGDFKQSISDILVLAEISSLKQALIAVLSDNVTLSDIRTLQWFFKQITAETLTLAEILSLKTDYKLIPSEVLLLNEIVSLLQIAPGISASDIITLNEILSISIVGAPTAEEERGGMFFPLGILRIWDKDRWITTRLKIFKNNDWQDRVFTIWDGRSWEKMKIGKLI